MYKKYLWVIAFAFSLVVSQSVLADSWGCGEGLKSMIDSLTLEKAQKEKIKPILGKLKSDMIDNGNQMKSLDQQITLQVNAVKVDQSALDGLIDKKAKLIGDMIKAKITAEIQIFGILKAQQKIELQGMMKKLEDKISAKFKSCHERN